MRTVILAALACLAVGASTRAGDPVTFESLLKEMVDRDAIARFPDPAYTCKQFSSYDRASTTPDDPKTWFTNGDYNQFLRTEQAPTPDGKTRKEWVLADMDGPGAVVRIWSANPKGNLRVYVDGAVAIEAPMTDALGGKWKVGKPLSEESSRGWNLYLPIPYAKHCKVTSDSDGFYYQVNYRTYAMGTEVRSLGADFDKAAMEVCQKALVAWPPPEFSPPIAADRLAFGPLPPGESIAILHGEVGRPGVISRVAIAIKSPHRDAALRSTVLTAEFDGEQTVWCPVGDFFSSGVGVNAFSDWYFRVNADGVMESFWRMPYQKIARLHLINLGSEPVEIGCLVVRRQTPDAWTDRSMHFHAAWHSEYPIHAYAGRGTKDWNYLEAAGQGVYVGDSLAVMNPVPEWWGEGDEKVYVDGETFPSHFGTGTEDYYGYAWGSNVPFQHPFHAQPRCDGQKHDNNWGHTTVTRVRSLDAIPFTTSLKFDMEVWHWRECDVAYAATTYFYAMPGATTNRAPQPEEAAKPIPQPPPLPPPFSIAGAIECENLKVLSQSPETGVGPQDLRGFGQRQWSGERQLWVRGKATGTFVELEIPTGSGPEGKEPVKLALYATKSWDYGILRFTVNGIPAGPDIDLFCGEERKAFPTGAIELGTFEPCDGRLILRAEVVGANPKAEDTKSYFGLDCIVLTPAGGRGK